MKINFDLILIILWVIAGLLVLCSEHITKLEYGCVWFCFIFGQIFDYIRDRIDEDGES